MGLPDLRDLKNLEILWVQNNRLTFEDIEPNVGVASKEFIYAPQDRVGEERDTTLVAGTTLRLVMRVGGRHNIFRWRKDGVLIEGGTDSVLSIPSVTMNDAGSYTCEITNTVATELTLYSRPIHVHIVQPQRVRLYFVVDTLQARGRSFWLSIYADGGPEPTSGLKDLRFTIEYDSRWIHLTGLDSVLLGSWLKREFKLAVGHDSLAKRLTFSIARMTSQGGVNGYGEIARTQWITDEATPKGTVIHFWFGSFFGVDNRGIPLAIDPEGTKVRIVSASYLPGPAGAGSSEKGGVAQLVLEVDRNRLQLNLGEALRIRYGVSGPHGVRLAVHNVAGELVRVLVNGVKPPGEHRVMWDGRDEEGRAVTPGLYLLYFESGGKRQIAKILVTR